MRRAFGVLVADVSAECGAFVSKTMDAYDICSRQVPSAKLCRAALDMQADHVHGAQPFCSPAACRRMQRGWLTGLRERK